MKTELNGKHLVITERYVDVKAASRYTSLAESTLYEWSGQGKLPSIKIGRRVLFDLHEIDQVMANLKRPYLQHEKTANKIIADSRDGDI